MSDLTKFFSINLKNLVKSNNLIFNKLIFILNIDNLTCKPNNISYELLQKRKELQQISFQPRFLS